jgi:hypothetical protein
MSGICPVCEGGRSGERSFNEYDYAGTHYGKCHRASCGFIISTPLHTYSGSLLMSAPGASPEVLRPYTGDSVALRPNDKRHLTRRFGFVPEGIRTVAYTCNLADTTYLIPILAPNGSQRGVMEASWGEFKRRRIWKAKHEPMISWTPEGDYYDGVYLVEDQISALKLHNVASVRGCALLGTSLNAESVAEIQRNARHVTIALDADATAKAFLLARKWGAAFKSCHVQILTKDLKDCTVQEIKQMVTDAGHCDFSGEFGE